MDLPGIGPVLAERIFEYRRQNGPFSSIEDIRRVSGIGEKRYEAIQDKITVG
jgi:competence protein ComEA